jgi:hypothetical protein
VPDETAEVDLAKLARAHELFREPQPTNGGDPPEGPVREPPKRDKREPVLKMVAQGMRQIGVLAVAFCWLDPAARGEGWTPGSVAAVVGVLIVGTALFGGGVVLERRRDAE